MRTPQHLQNGDTIAIIAPAGKIDQSKVQIAQRRLESWGLNVVLGTHLFDHDFQYAASDENRFHDFQVMLDNPDIRAILCARGGYGTIRIIDRLNFDLFRANPKWIIGFSDITLIHSHILKNLELETIHGCMAGGFDLQFNDPQSSETLRKALFGENLAYRVKHHSLSRGGKCEGELTGGNMAILCSIVGSNSDFDTTGKILFIEETGEHHYRIDRMINTITRAGKLDRIAGLIVGGITEIPDSAEHFGKTAFEIVADAVQKYDFPVSFGFPAGHIRDNRALIMGRKAHLSVGSETTLIFEHSVSHL